MSTYFPRTYKPRRGLAPPVVIGQQRFSGGDGLGGQLQRVKGMVEWINNQKIEKTSAAMTMLWQNKRWPESGKDITAYIGRTGTSRVFGNADRLIQEALRNPLKSYDKTWRFEPNNTADVKLLLEAARFAFGRSKRYAYKHIGDTKQYLRSHQMYVRNGRKGRLKPFSGSVTEESLGRFPQFLIVSNLEYSSSLEAHAVERAKNGGMMFQAAKETARKYPQLLVKYFAPAAQKLGLPQVGKRPYGIPTIIISARGQGTKATRSRPGRNIRRRRSARGSGVANSYGAKQMYSYYKGLRRINGYRRSDERNYGNELYSYRAAWRRANRKRR